MSYSVPEILLIIAAIGAVTVNIITSFYTGKSVNKTLEKAVVIEGHVNSKETKYVEQITALIRENEILRGVIIDKEKVAALLAQSVAQKINEVK